MVGAKDSIDFLLVKLKKQNVTIQLDARVDDEVESALREKLGATILDTLNSAEEALQEAALPVKFHDKILRVKEALATESWQAAVIQALLTEITHDLLAELSEPMFLHVNAARRDLYVQREPPFGVEVETRFEDSGKDIAAAARCFAMDVWTACVFHSMRVLEHGLRAMAERFEVSFTVDSWHKVIKGIEDGINELRNRSGLTDWDRLEITYYSEAAAQFRYFKDAWRNHVAHARMFYDERDADRVFSHVRDFMQQLATPL
jgi:hypothetical protein